MQLFFNARIQASDTTFTFDKAESKHIVQVLRKTKGSLLYITDGLGHLFIAEIITANPKNCAIVVKKIERKAPLPYHLHLAVAPTKMNERFEWFLEKATEIGISEITPIICERSERKIIKPERLKKIIQTATKQSLRYYLPKLNEAIFLSDFLLKDHSRQKFIAHCQSAQNRFLLQDKVKPNTTTTILIGPEGDFTAKEIETAKKTGYLAVLLGNSRLRTETAAIVACHTVAITNNFGSI